MEKNKKEFMIENLILFLLLLITMVLIVKVNNEIVSYLCMGVIFLYYAFIHFLKMRNKWFNYKNKGYYFGIIFLLIYFASLKMLNLEGKMSNNFIALLGILLFFITTTAINYKYNFKK